jgi:hypothetical protein
LLYNLQGCLKITGLHMHQVELYINMGRAGHYAWRGAVCIVVAQELFKPYLL